MKYVGSKNRIAKYILPIILANRKPGQVYVEPFLGGANLIDKVLGLRLGCDINKYLIAMFQAIQKEWIPPETITEQEYSQIKNDKESYPQELVGFVGVGCSYSGKWFGGYARGNTNKGVPRNYCLESQRNLLKQAKDLKEIVFVNCNYHNLRIPSHSLIYCDPPYANTTKYSGNFNHSEFWHWCRNKIKEGHVVFISEYAAPVDFKCVWEKEIISSLTKNTGSKRGIEKLFVGGNNDTISEP